MFSFLHKTSSLLVTLYLLFGTNFVNSREIYEIHEDHNLKTPRVRDYECEYCAFNDGENYWCLGVDFTFNAGWEITQAYDDTNEISTYDIKLLFYVQPDFEIHPDFTLV